MKIVVSHVSFSVLDEASDFSINSLSPGECFSKYPESKKLDPSKFICFFICCINLLWFMFSPL